MKSVLTVLAPSNTFDLTVLATVKDELQIDGTKSDNTLRRYITQASAAIAQYCNRVLAKQGYREAFWATRDAYPYLIPGGLDKLQLAAWPLGAVTAVIEDEVPLVADADYRVAYDEGQLIRLDANGYPKPWPALPLQVDYTAGYDLIETLPPDIEDACIRMVKARWNARGRDPFLKARSVDIPGVRSTRDEWWVSTSPVGNMPPDIADLLDNYRTPVVG